MSEPLNQHYQEYDYENMTRDDMRAEQKRLNDLGQRGFAERVWTGWNFHHQPWKKLRADDGT